MKPSANGFRVLVLSHLYPYDPQDLKGIFVRRQVAALGRLGCDITVLSPVPSNPLPFRLISRSWARHARAPRLERMDDHEVHRPRYLEYPRLLGFASSGRRMARAVGAYVTQTWPEFPFDLIHAHVALPDGIAGAELKARFSRPLCLTVHGQDLQQTIYRDAPSRRAVAAALEAADRVITVSEKLRRTALAELQPGTRITVINNGVELASLPDPERIPRHENLVVCLANLIPLKQVDQNIEALALLADEFPALRLRLIGDGPERSRLERLAAALGVRDRVELLGARPNTEAVRLIAEGAFFSLPSRPEGFGVAYLEAMAMGLAVIGCRAEGIADIVSEHDVGLLVSGDSAGELAQAWRALLSDADACRRLGERGRLLVQSQFAWDTKARQIVAVYRDLGSAPETDVDGRA